MEPMRQEVTVPFAKRKVPVLVDFQNHPAIKSLAEWGPKLRKRIEEACFAQYRKKVDSIGPGLLPKIWQSSQVWRHMKIQSVRIDPAVMNRVVVYVVPAWDIDEHLEWCVEGAHKLVYVGQFLGYPVDGY
jgi:hypothetical protein